MPRRPPALLFLMLSALPSCASPGPPVMVCPEVPGLAADVRAGTAGPDLDAPGWDRTLAALWIVDVMAAGEDCRSRLAAVRRLVDEGKPRDNRRRDPGVSPQ